MSRPGVAFFHGQLSRNSNTIAGPQVLQVPPAIQGQERVISRRRHALPKHRAHLEDGLSTIGNQINDRPRMQLLIWTKRVNGKRMRGIEQPSNRCPFSRHRIEKGGTAYYAFVEPDRKSTRLNSSHGYISYAVFCLKKKKNINYTRDQTIILQMI